MTQPDPSSLLGLATIDFLRSSATTHRPNTLDSQSPEVIQIDIVYLTSYITLLFFNARYHSFLLLEDNKLFILMQELSNDKKWG